MTPGKNWTIEITSIAERQLENLDPVVTNRIRTYIRKLGQSDDPKRHGLKMAGMDDTWRFRVGNYRILASVHADRLCILILQVGARGGVYKRRHR